MSAGSGVDRGRVLPPADVCLLLEGTYPYVAGGVSSWVHDLLSAHPGLVFDVVSMVPDSRARPQRYKPPPNLRRLIDLPLQDPPLGRAVREVPPEAFALFDRLAAGTAVQEDFAGFERAQGRAGGKLGRRALLDSPAAFAAACSAYARLVPDASFLDFFWTWRSLLSAALSVMLLPTVPARCYHSVSTGFGGLLGARFAVTTGRPLILSEHGIYTNERRIEVAMADWLFRDSENSLAPEKLQRDLRDLWVGAFECFSRLTYAAADPILTLYRGNQVLQRRDGADPSRLGIVPNGIDADRYAAVPRQSGHPPTVALIGRVVPIKDVKTLIRAAAILRRRVPEVRVEILGPQEEDPVYARECGMLVAELGLVDTVFFRGRVSVMDWLGRIDVNVLTSISEAQPLTILEAGAAGVPCVATDVGACREMIEGDPLAPDGLGPGGVVTPVADPAATAEALAALLLDAPRRARAAASIQSRIRAKYLKTDCDASYARIYAAAMAASRTETITPVDFRLPTREGLVSFRSMFSRRMPDAAATMTTSDVAWWNVRDRLDTLPSIPAASSNRPRA